MTNDMNLLGYILCLVCCYIFTSMDPNFFLFSAKPGVHRNTY